jgi:hypothetical protein
MVIFFDSKGKDWQKFFRVSKVCAPCTQTTFRLGFLRDFLCSSLLCHPNIHRVFRRLYLSLNICSFEGIFDRNCIRITFFRASSASILFECGLRSLESFSFGPAAPSTYSRQGFGPSNYLFRASSAFKIFEARLWPFELPFRPSDDFKEFELEL